MENMSIMKDNSTTQDKTIASAGQEINLRIAGRVRALRIEQGLTLDALAAKSEVSRSMLSLIERGESSPTAVVLDRIATGLGVSLASLFDDGSAPPNPISRRADRIPWRDPASGYIRRNLSPANFPTPIHIVEVELPAGASVAYETGARDVSIHQQIWVQAGSIELALGNVTYQLDEDDCLAMQLDAPTTFRNRTDQPARYIVVIVTEHGRTQRR
ncbi:MAG: XRE family transcriptional regulator [Caldilinea sp. CFX5]|nr:XRE family transcriptional regulator [Caldilinea sp. CFX5]